MSSGINAAPIEINERLESRNGSKSSNLGQEPLKSQHKTVSLRVAMTFLKQKQKYHGISVS